MMMIMMMIINLVLVSAWSVMFLCTYISKEMSTKQHHQKTKQNKTNKQKTNSNKLGLCLSKLEYRRVNYHLNLFKQYLNIQLKCCLEWNTDTWVGWWGFDHNSHIFYQIAFFTLHTKQCLSWFPWNNLADWNKKWYVMNMNWGKERKPQPYQLQWNNPLCPSPCTYAGIFFFTSIWLYIGHLHWNKYFD